MIEFVNFRGQDLTATIIEVGGQKFVMAAFGERLDAAPSPEIRSGQALTETATGDSWAILKTPESDSEQIMIRRRSKPASGPFKVSTEDLRRDFQFVAE